MNKELKELIHKAKPSLDILLEKKKKISLSKSANKRANLRKDIYPYLSSLNHLMGADKVTLNEFSIRCILNMFDNERAILVKQKTENYSKKEIQFWISEMDKYLKDLKNDYNKTSDENDFNYYNLKLDKLGVEAEFYYYCLLDRDDNNREENILALINTMISLIEVGASIEIKIFKKNNKQLERHFSYWLEKFFERVPDTKKGQLNSKLDTLCAFETINQGISPSEYAQWHKLCLLIKTNIIDKNIYPVSAKIKKYVNPSNLKKFNEIENKNIKSTDSSPSFNWQSQPNDSSLLDVALSLTTLSQGTVSFPKNAKKKSITTEISDASSNQKKTNLSNSIESNLDSTQSLLELDSKVLLNTSFLNSKTSTGTSDNDVETSSPGSTLSEDHDYSTPVKTKSFHKRKIDSINDITNEHSKQQKTSSKGLQLIKSAYIQLEEEMQFYSQKNFFLEQKLEKNHSKIDYLEKSHQELKNNFTEKEAMVVNLKQKLIELEKTLSKKNKELEAKSSAYLKLRDKMCILVQENQTLKSQLKENIVEKPILSNSLSQNRMNLFNSSQFSSTLSDLTITTPNAEKK